jgi:predicted DNA-binding transcriptional regulator AlpA
MITIPLPNNEHREVSLEDLIKEIHSKVEGIEQKLNNPSDQIPPSDVFMNISQLCEYIPKKPQKSTVYSWVSKRMIPYLKPAGSKSLVFSKHQIDEWLLSGRRKTASEIKESAIL